MARTENIYLKTYTNRNQALNLRSQGKIREASQLLTESLQTVEQTGSIWLQALIERDLGTALFLQNDVNAQQHLRKASRLEKSFRPQLVFNRSHVMMLFAEAALDYKSSIEKYQEIFFRNDHKIENTLATYFLGTMQYVHGTTDAHREQGRRILRMVHETGAHKLTRESALKTLKNKKLNPFL